MCTDNGSRELSLARKTARMGHLIHRFYQKESRMGGGPDPLRGQGRVLALLAAKPETTQRELSYVLDMRQQSLSELLGKLEDKGYVTREKSAEDGRVTAVRLTDAGAAAAPGPDDLERRADALSCLSAEERAQLETIADKVCASLEEQLGDDGERGHGHGQRRHRGGEEHLRRGPHRPHADEDGPMLKRGPHGPHGFGLEGGGTLRQA